MLPKALAEGSKIGYKKTPHLRGLTKVIDKGY